MKKVLLILSVLVIVVALAGGLTTAYAKDKGNGRPQVVPLCDEWLIGTITDKSVSAQDGNITLMKKGDGAVTIAVSSNTKYMAWLASWQVVTFGSLQLQDLIAVCVKDNVAELVVLLEPPQKPFYLNLQGNVTDVQGGNITVQTAGGGNFTIDLSGVSVDLSSLSGAMGQPVNLTIGKYVPFFGKYFPGLHLGWFIGKGNQGGGAWKKDYEGKMEKFRERFEQKFEQRFEKWQEHLGN